MERSGNRVSLVLVAMVGVVIASSRVAHAGAPAGQVTWAQSVSLPPAWFEPAEATGTLIPFSIYYALHDALAKPLPGKAMAPSLAESWTASADGLTHEFVLRQGVRFHNGDPVPPPT